MNSLKALILFSKSNEFWYSTSDVYLQSCLGFTYGFACSQTRFPVHLENYIFSFENGHGYEVVALNDAERVADYYFEKFRKDRKYFIHLKKKWLNQIKIGQKIYEKLLSADLKKFNDIEIY